MELVKAAGSHETWRPSAVAATPPRPKASPVGSYGSFWAFSSLLGLAGYGRNVWIFSSLLGLAGFGRNVWIFSSLLGLAGFGRNVWIFFLSPALKDEEDPRGRTGVEIAENPTETIQWEHFSLLVGLHLKFRGFPLFSSRLCLCISSILFQPSPTRRN